MASKNKRLSLGEYLSFIWTVVSIPIISPFVGLRNIISPRPGSQGAIREAIRFVLKRLTEIPTRQWIACIPNLSTGSAVSKFARSRKLSHERIPLPAFHGDDGGILHLISPSASPSTPDTITTNACDTSNRKILLYCHGGGYLNAAGPSHMPFAYQCALSIPGGATLAILEYTLSSTAAYPTQLCQALSALSHVLSLTSPKNVILAGDSAGAHLVAGTLSAVMHPEIPLFGLGESGSNRENEAGLYANSEIVERIRRSLGDDQNGRVRWSERLGGICLISPMLSFDITKESYTVNGSQDYLSSVSVNGFLALLSPPSASPASTSSLPFNFASALSNPHLSPSDAPAGHWKDLPVSRILITIGTNEVFQSSAIELWEVLTRENGILELNAETMIRSNQINTGKAQIQNQKAGGISEESNSTKIEIELAKGEGEWHAAPIVDSLFWLKERPKGTKKAIIDWMARTK